jgi:hypothetical protein
MQSYLLFTRITNSFVQDYLLCAWLPSFYAHKELQNYCIYVYLLRGYLRVWGMVETTAYTHTCCVVCEASLASMSPCLDVFLRVIPGTSTATHVSRYLSQAPPLQHMCHATSVCECVCLYTWSACVTCNYDRHVCSVCTFLYTHDVCVAYVCTYVCNVPRANVCCTASHKLAPKYIYDTNTHVTRAAASRNHISVNRPDYARVSELVSIQGFCNHKVSGMPSFTWSDTNACT